MQRIIPTLDMRRFSRVLANAFMIVVKYILVRLPKVAHRLCIAISLQYTFLELFTNICTASAHSIGHDFAYAYASAQANPEPEFVGVLLERMTRPHRVQAHRRSGRVTAFHSGWAGSWLFCNPTGNSQTVDAKDALKPAYARASR